MAKRTFNIAQIAKVIDRNRMTIRRRIMDGRLKADLVMGAYQARDEDVRTWLEEEGYSIEAIERIMRDLATMTSEPDRRHHGTPDTADVMGRLYALLVHCGAETFEHLAAEAAATPGRFLGQLTARALRLPDYRRKIEPKLAQLLRRLKHSMVTNDPWPEYMQGRFWIGYYSAMANFAAEDADADGAASAAAVANEPVTGSAPEDGAGQDRHG